MPPKDDLVVPYGLDGAEQERNHPPIQSVNPTKKETKCSHLFSYFQMAATANCMGLMPG